jgi:hypothetical protein
VPFKKHWGKILCVINFYLEGGEVRARLHGVTFQKIITDVSHCVGSVMPTFLWFILPPSSGWKSIFIMQMEASGQWVLVGVRCGV